MKFLHTMVRVANLEKSLAFYCDALGLVVCNKKEYPEGKFTLVFLSTPDDVDHADAAQIELTYNWEQSEPYSEGRNFGHIAFQVDDIYSYCERLQQHNIIINRPPRDGRMAFVRSPDGISIEILQRGEAKPIIEPWLSMPNVGSW